MDFEIEDEDLSYDFSASSNYKKKSNKARGDERIAKKKSVFSNDVEDADEYDFEVTENFGSKSKSTDRFIPRLSEKDKPGSSKSSKKDNTSVKTDNMSALERAQSMLSKYSNSGNSKPAPNKPKKVIYEFDEDDISVEESDEFGNSYSSNISFNEKKEVKKTAATKYKCTHKKPVYPNQSNQLLDQSGIGDDSEMNITGYIDPSSGFSVDGGGDGEQSGMVEEEFEIPENSNFDANKQDAYSAIDSAKNTSVATLATATVKAPTPIGTMSADVTSENEYEDDYEDDDPYGNNPNPNFN